MLEQLSELYGLTINELLCGKKLEQEEFKEAADITGIILTKLDGTAKGGITFAIKNEYDIPVKLVGVGEGIDDIEFFDSHEFVSGIIDTDEE